MSGLTVAAVLAAGASRRFGADKLLQDLGGAGVLERTVRAVGAAGVDRLFCVTPAGDDARAAPARAAGAQIITNAAAAEGLSASVRLAAARAQTLSATRLLIALGDAPLIPADHYRALLAKVAPGAALAFTAVDGARRPPAAFDRSMFAALAAARGDAGARALLADAPTAAGTALDAGLAADIDTPADLARAAAALGAPAGAPGRA